MWRRKALQALGTASVAAISGCVGILEGAGGYVTLSNADDVEHTVRILIRDGESTEFERETTIAPEEIQEFEDAFNGGSYLVEVELEDRTTREFDLDVGSCSSIKLLVTVTNNGEINISQGYCD